MGSALDQGTATTTAARCFYNIEFYKKINIDMDWDSTTGAITEIKSNNIFIIAGLDGPAEADDQWQIVGTARLRFVG